MPRRSRRRSFQGEEERLGCLRNRKGEGVEISLNMRFGFFEVLAPRGRHLVMRVNRPRRGDADLSQGLQA